MDERKIKDLPLGTSDFIALRMADQLYVDKTDLVYKIASVRRKYFFLVREDLVNLCLFLHSKLYSNMESSTLKVWRLRNSEKSTRSTRSLDWTSLRSSLFSD